MKSSKRNRVLLLLLAGVLGTTGIYWGLIKRDRRILAERDKKLTELREQAAQTRRKLELADKFQEAVAKAEARIQTVEQELASGDIYRWFINRMLPFQSEELEFENFEPPVISEVEQTPKLPYKAAIFPVRGAGYYHDVGTFIAQLENSSPYWKVQSIQIEPASVGASPEDEKLQFKLEVMVLVKSSGLP